MFLLTVLFLALMLSIVINYGISRDNKRKDERIKQLEDWVAHDRQKRIADASQVLKELFH